MQILSVGKSINIVMPNCKNVIPSSVGMSVLRIPCSTLYIHTLNNKSETYSHQENPGPHISSLNLQIATFSILILPDVWDWIAGDDGNCQSSADLERSSIRRSINSKNNVVCNDL